MRRRPTLLNSCAWAATAAETRFRIEPPDFAARASRVIALDEQATLIVDGLAGPHWSGGHFLTYEAVVPANGSGGEPTDATLRATDGSPRLLSEELDGADVAVMIATGRARPEAASVIGDACATRMIMSAGLVVPSAGEVGQVVTALRPNAMVLVVLKSENEVPAILTALRV